MNKNARKLIPAVAMLLVSASMLSTASYAWFSMNNKVTAGGMNVNVVTPGDIEISEDIAFSTTDDSRADLTKADLTKATNYKLAPVSSISGAADKFFIADPKTIVNSDKQTAGDETKISEVPSDSADVTVLYGSTAFAYVDYTFYVRTTSTTEKNIALDETTKFEVVSTANGAILPAFRFSVLVDDKLLNNSVWVGADNAATPPKAWIAKKDAGISMAEDTHKGTVEKYTAGNVITELPAATVEENGTVKASAKKITIRIWLEGEDTACKIENTTNMAEYKLTVVFVVKENS